MKLASYAKHLPPRGSVEVEWLDRMALTDKQLAEAIWLVGSTLLPDRVSLDFEGLLPPQHLVEEELRTAHGEPLAGSIEMRCCLLALSAPLG